MREISTLDGVLECQQEHFWAIDDSTVSRKWEITDSFKSHWLVDSFWHCMLSSIDFC
eukprot:m.201819 g.201819  ORF g.201819 m.201819 type:complete len:57 (+) comp10683_c0_seq10:925-1095(+)